MLASFSGKINLAKHRGNRSVFAVFVPGLQEGDGVRGESCREGTMHCFSSYGGLGEAASEIVWAGMKTAGSHGEDLGDCSLGGDAGKSKGEKHS